MLWRRKSKLVWNWISEGQMWPLPHYLDFWLPPPLPVPCSTPRRKHGRSAWEVGGRRGEAETCLNQRRTRCNNPLRWSCVEWEISFPTEKHCPMWTWHPPPSPPPLVYFHSLICSLRLLFSFSVLLFLQSFRPCITGVPSFRGNDCGYSPWTFLSRLYYSMLVAVC